MPETRPHLDHDVIVVGASVAGCRAALTLAERGVGALLLDQARFPRWKPCAGGLTLKTRPYLPEPLFDLVERTIHSALFTLGDAYVTRLRSEAPLGWMVHRESFDEVHLELARAQPTVDVVLGLAVREVVEEPHAVRIETQAGTLRCRALIGADGARSVVSRSLPGHAERLRGFAYEGEARSPRADVSQPPKTRGDLDFEGASAPSSARTAPPSDEAVFDFRTFPRGYGWVFPKADHISIGGFVCDRKLPGIKGIYEQFCNQREWLRGWETYRAKGHPTCLGGGARRLSSQRIVLTGEAGSLLDPLTGEGIYYALRSGHLAGEAVAGFLREGWPLAGYGDRVRTEIQEDLRCAGMFARILFKHPRIGFHLLLRNALLCRWFAEVGSGARTYRSLLREALKKGWLLPFHAGIGRGRELRVDLRPGPASS